jgi:hypothetical protein
MSVEPVLCSEKMKIGERTLNYAICVFVLVVLQALTIPAQAKPTVTFTSPCECIGNHGVSRWAAKTDLQEPPANADIKKITPAHILAWQGPGDRIDQRTERIAAEHQWYAVTGRIEKVRVEDDGDVHVEMKDIGADASIVVELPLGPRWCEMRKTVFSWTNATFPLTGKFKLLQHPVITVVGKAFYDIDHSGKTTQTNRRNYDDSLAVWEIHPVMNMTIGTADSRPTAATSSVPKISAPPPIAIPQPQPTGAPAQFVTLTKPVPVQIPYGSTILPPGTKLQLLSRDAQTVDVRYLDSRYTIPILSTDLR